MPMSDICRNSRRASAPTAFPFRPRSGGRRTRARFPVPGASVASIQGFTLLELLVVLVLVALVTALAIPNLERLQASLTRKTERDYILDQFAGLSRQAMLHGRSYVVFGTGGAQEAEPSVPAREPAGAAAAAWSRQPAGHAFEAPLHADHERYVIDVPDGWEIWLDEPLVIRANGVCLGAELILRHRGTVDTRVDLEPPYCRIDSDA